MPANSAGNLSSHPENKAQELEGHHETPLGHLGASTGGQSGSHDVQHMTARQPHLVNEHMLSEGFQVTH